MRKKHDFCSFRIVSMYEFPYLTASYLRLFFVFRYYFIINCRVHMCVRMYDSTQQFTLYAHYSHYSHVQDVRDVFEQRMNSAIILSFSGSFFCHLLANVIASKAYLTFDYIFCYGVTRARKIVISFTCFCMMRISEERNEFHSSH